MRVLLSLLCIVAFTVQSATDYFVREAVDWWHERRARK